MKDEKLELFKKGKFINIDNDFMIEGHEVLQNVSKIQIKYNKNDTDTFINELRDSIVGYTLGFSLINIEKHGFDCKKSTNEEKYLEVKSANFTANSWQATFNDTTFEKCEAFKDKKLYLALAIWKNASDLLFICYGQNEKIGLFLEEKVKWFKNGNTVRSTQSISLSKLIFDYDFKILSISKTKDELFEILRLKNREFNKLSKEKIIEFKDFDYKTIY